MPSSFCVAPWIHAHVGADGNRRLCCIAKEAPAGFAKLQYSEFKNSAYLRNIKKLMLEGVTPKECHYCDNINRTDVYRDELNKEYAHHIEDIVKSTSEDGYSESKIKFIDYRSNLCNLKCRTCSPSCSSTFNRNIRSQPEDISRLLFQHDFGTDEKEISDFFSLNYAPEMLNLIDTNEIDRIYFAGGEPVIEPNHIPFLQKLVADGRSSQTRLFYNTNLSFAQRQIERWTSVLQNFTDVHIFVSVDGYGEICEYIRDGVDFEKLKTNIDYLISNFNFNVSLDITLTSLNLFYLEDFSNFAIKHNVKVVSKLMIGQDDSFPLLRAEAIPQIQKSMIIKRWNSYYKELPLESQELLLNLKKTIDLFEAKDQKLSYSTQEQLIRLVKFESMYPTKKKFLDLIRKDTIGSDWFNLLIKDVKE